MWLGPLKARPMTQRSGGPAVTQGVWGSHRLVATPGAASARLQAPGSRAAATCRVLPSGHRRSSGVPHSPALQGRTQQPGCCAGLGVVASKACLRSSVA